MTNFIEIDGAEGEGGGQVLRTSLTLSLLTGKPFRLFHVRARRSKPGLQPQHLTCVKAAAEIGSAQLRGASVGSSDLSFTPGTIRAGNYRFDVGTAGATSLVLHTIALPLALRSATPCEVSLTGGTHVSNSPSFHFLDGTWRPYLELLGVRVGLRLERPGFYPRGGGVVRAVLHPGVLTGRAVEARGATEASVTAAVAGLDKGIARRMARRTTQGLEALGLRVTAREETWDGGPGAAAVVTLATTPAATVFAGVGARGKPAEAVADEAVAAVESYLEQRASTADAVDEHSADQLVLPMALAEGASEYRTGRVTLHLTTNVGIVRRFVEREIVVEGEEGQPGRVVVR